MSTPFRLVIKSPFAQLHTSPSSASSLSPKLPIDAVVVWDQPSDFLKEYIIDEDGNVVTHRSSAAALQYVPVTVAGVRGYVSKSNLKVEYLN